MLVFTSGLALLGLNLHSSWRAVKKTIANRLICSKWSISDSLFPHSANLVSCSVVMPLYFRANVFDALLVPFLVFFQVIY